MTISTARYSAQLVDDQLRRVGRELGRPQPSQRTIAWLMGIESTLRWMNGDSVGPVSDVPRAANPEGIARERIAASMAAMRGDDFARGSLRVLDWVTGFREELPAPFAA